MKLKLLFISILLILSGLKMRDAQAQSIYDQALNQRIDFRLFYPIVQFKDSSFKKRQKNFAGFDLTYSWLLEDEFGFSGTTGAWFVPIRKVNDKAMLYSLYATMGALGRPFPDSYFDPTLHIQGGVSGTDAGGLSNWKISIPMISRLSINLYRETERFQDNALALSLKGSAGYTLRQIAFLKPWYFDFGLAFSGSF